MTVARVLFFGLHCVCSGPYPCGVAGCVRPVWRAGVCLVAARWHHKVLANLLIFRYCLLFICFLPLHHYLNDTSERSCKLDENILFASSYNYLKSPLPYKQ